MCLIQHHVTGNAMRIMLIWHFVLANGTVCSHCEMQQRAESKSCCIMTSHDQNCPIFVQFQVHWSATTLTAALYLCF
jgi:hypothetical protein